MRTRALLNVLSCSVAAAAVAALTVAHAAAQTPLVPYYGKNNIHYDTFNWRIYTTEHFEIYYYPEMEKHLQRVTSYAESAYQQISADLKHDLPSKIQLILFKTHSEFEEENVDPTAAQEGVGAFAEPLRLRMVMPIDDAPDQLYGLIVHELTHQFQFDIIPQSLIRRNYPLWVGEGGAEFERANWTPIDLMDVRDAAISDIVPKMTETEGYGNIGNNARLVPYNLGHAVFEFIEAKWGKEGVRQFMFSLRKSVIGAGEDAYEEAFKMKKDEFDQAFDRYLKDRFKPFRDKERPADYGRDLAPNREKTEFAEALSLAPSPSGDLLAMVTFNRKDGELDIILVSSKDGSIVRNLTEGFDKDLGFDHLVLPGNGERMEMPWLSWSPKGDRLAYFVRTEKEHTLIVQNVLTRKIEVRIPMKTVDEPESPAFAPDGRTIAFAAHRDGIADIYTVDLMTKAITNLTDDEFHDAAPTYSPDGKFIIYSARISGNQKLFRFDVDSKRKTQITFGTVDETAAQFLNDHTIVFSSTATDPAVPLEPEVARNGNVYNIWTLDLNTGEMRQYTDVVGGNWCPVVLKGAQGANDRVVFISYYKAEYSVRAVELKEPLHTAAESDFGAPGGIIDFQPPMQHTLNVDNERQKKMFEKMFLEGRPPVNVGVTSNGDIFGGSSVTFGDVLGDKQFNVYASSIAQYRTFAASYTNLSRRLQWAVQGYTQTLFYYPYAGTFYDPALDYISRDQAIATQTIRGGSALGIYPLNRYQRLEFSAGLLNLNEEFSDPALQQQAQAYQQQTYGHQLFRTGTVAPLQAAFVQETTIFREFGPLAGSTMRLGYDVSPPIGGLLSRQTVDVDVRHYMRLGSTGLLATRFRGLKSTGDSPDFLFFGGNSEMHGYDYLSFIGQNAAFADAELRFPIIEAALTPIGVIGGIRGMFFFNIGGGWFSDAPSPDLCVAGAGTPPTQGPVAGSGYSFATSQDETCRGVKGFIADQFGQPVADANGNAILVYTDPTKVSGFRLKDGRASYGVGLETFALGFPVHFEWSWRTLFNKAWEDVLFAGGGGSSAFRKARFSMWIGYDF